MTRKPTHSIFQRFAAWGVHVFTASGIVSAFMALIATEQGEWVEAFWWLLLCLFIDGIDGTFARIFRVKEVLPNVSGKDIDFVIDFVTYAFIPAYFFYRAVEVPDGFDLPLSFLILLVSAIYYGKQGMVSDDNYFIGYPVIWNIAVFYLFFVFGAGPVGNAIIVVILSIMHFMPIKFVYPSRATRFFWPTLAFTILIFVALVGILWNWPEPGIFLWLAWLPIIYYALMAIYNTWLE